MVEGKRKEEKGNDFIDWEKKEGEGLNRYGGAFAILPTKQVRGEKEGGKREEGRRPVLPCYALGGKRRERKNRISAVDLVAIPAKKKKRGGRACQLMLAREGGGRGRNR